MVFEHGWEKPAEHGLRSSVCPPLLWEPLRDAFGIVAQTIACLVPEEELAAHKKEQKQEFEGRRPWSDLTPAEKIFTAVRMEVALDAAFDQFVAEFPDKVNSKKKGKKSDGKPGMEKQYL